MVPVQPSYLVYLTLIPMRPLLPTLILYGSILALLSCAGEAKNTSTAPATEVDNEELKALYRADQADRQTGDIDWSVVSQRDEQRQKRVMALLDSNAVRTALDYANAAMVFQHGLDTFASGMAVSLMRKAVELDTSRSKWLLAAAIDRDLMRRGKPQIYGTQYLKMGADEPWERYELDSTQVTDEERIIYGVETLAEQGEKVQNMNKEQLMALYQAGTGVATILESIQSEDPRYADYDHSEDGANRFGYQLMGTGEVEEALLVFEWNTKRYPDSYNAYDSYGECLLQLGKTAEGRAAYQKSLDLNPKNTNAADVLGSLAE